MPPDRNPYAAPSSVSKRDASDSRPRFPGRTFVAYLLAGAVALTAILLGALWVIGGIDLGRFGVVFLGSLLVAAAILVLAAIHYATGSRRTAVSLAAIAPLVIFSAVLLALHDAGVISLF